MSHGMIRDDFYDHPRIRALRPAGKQLAAYLCANRHTHYSGIYHVSVADISIDLEMSENDVAHWLQVLEEGPVEFPVDAERRPGGFGYFVEYDWERSVVWVRGMLKVRTGVHGLNKKQKDGMTKYLSKFTNCPLVGRFLLYYAPAGIPMPKGYAIPHSDGVQPTLPGWGTGRKVLRF